MYRNLNSAILVMKSAKDRLRCNDAEVLNRAEKWDILVERAMNS